MRVGIISIQHESNTFVHCPTTLGNFKHDVYASDEVVHRVFHDSKHELGGFFAGLRGATIEAVPIFAARAVPSGPVTSDALNHLTSVMLDRLDTACPLDGLLVAPHGAAVCESISDMDGYWLGLVRQRIGSGVPIVCTLDAHANLSQRMVDACDATIAYRTNPHVDQYARGLEAASLMAKTLSGSIRPTQAASLVPIVINIERQYTDAEPCRSLYALADEMLELEGVLSNSVVLGFPYADVEEMGASAIVVTDGDSALASNLANELGAALIAQRERFVPQLVGIEKALDRAMQFAGAVCLLDMGDNVGGGSSADGTLILHALRHRNGIKSIACLYDPVAAKKAVTAGVGARLLNLSMGGNLDDRLGPPLIADVRVVSTHSGRFFEHEVRHGGKTEYDMGATAVVETDFGATIVLNSQRTPPFSLKQLTSCGIVPEQYKLLIAKGVQAPRAAYSAVCKYSIRVNTPGPTSADLSKLCYRNRRKPLFPFELDHIHAGYDRSENSFT